MTLKKIDINNFVYKINPDLSTVDWAYVCELFSKIDWRTRVEDEIESAFRKVPGLYFVNMRSIIAFGRVVGDGRFML